MSIWLKIQELPPVHVVGCLYTCVVDAARVQFITILFKILPYTNVYSNFSIPIGIVRTVYTGPDIVCDYMPVDIAIKALIIATWKKATSL